ncbi:MAG: cell division protein FtsQ [Thiothrix nivea]|nr:MAG: cell division protein FtsQ [Thiothrix nivea]
MARILKPRPDRKLVKRQVPKSTTVGRRTVLKKQRKNPLQSLTLSPRLLNVLLGVAVLMVLGGAVMWSMTWLNNPENLRISKVELNGDLQYLKPAELQALAGPYVATNLYLLDADGLEEELEANPWVRSVSLNKAWPEQLFINVEEQYPVAFWGKDQLMNKFGEIFPGTLVGKAGVFPMIYSPVNGGREMAERYVRLMKLLDGLGLEIMELTEDERGVWRMKFRQGQEVIMGRKEQEKRIRRFRVGYMQALRAKFSDVRLVDLRYTNGFAVEWKQGSDQIGAMSDPGTMRPEWLGS